MNWTLCSGIDCETPCKSCNQIDAKLHLFLVTEKSDCSSLGDCGS